MTKGKNNNCANINGNGLPYCYTQEEIQQMEQQELENYEARVLMTPSERRALRKWVASGHSVYENPGSRYLCISSGDADYDYLSVYRIDHEIRCELRGKTPAERESYLREYIGWCEESEEEQAERIAREQTPALARKHIRELERELFHIWEFISHEGLWSEACAYIDSHKDEPVPFEW